MTSIIGFCGAHRSGKSTLQHALCEKYGATLLQMPTYKVQGNRVKTELPLAERVSLQYQILEAYEEVLEEAASSAAAGVVISDRTPIDVIAYMLADVTRTADYGLDVGILHYIQLAQSLTLKYFSRIVILPPGVLPLVEDPTSSPCSAAYIEHIHALCYYYLNDLRFESYEGRMAYSYYLPISLGSDFEKRLKFCEHAFAPELLSNRVDAT